MAEKAVEILNEYKLMDRPVVANRILAFEERRHGMYLGNIDPEESIDRIKRLCMEAIEEGDDNVRGLHVSKSFKRDGMNL